MDKFEYGNVTQICYDYVTSPNSPLLESDRKFWQSVMQAAGESDGKWKESANSPITWIILS